ncbi:prolipoprotein diacylglyceryl transferase [Iodidimonas nitroreducens]|uniref:Phosphatidylglycerol--prolipoprotein diacylglyceryl transferase n=1 Tax=Iodidimonas nitroreducens TaxID=1236968 RepID=A0A5A7N6A1_9PROT|nr:prolipoprotein diacylglyceryl transferase [Iodidimonas nitroreducens]GAK32373.1 prolipoprotein diacylglyceryl transferase [alpha proteobacterium Q-1]GER03165.1 prolipoprotein diacylglyceryl transferase [Iodidimonas nitroreducens]
MLEFIDMGLQPMASGPAFLLANGVLAYPQIDPVLVSIFGFPIRWYSLAYLVGLLGGWLWVRKVAVALAVPITRRQIDDFLTWATLGVILGGRLGYVLFYKPAAYLDNPMAILRLWDGGMSFHGGLLGVTLAIIFYARAQKLPLLGFADMIAAAVPIGLLFGRLANFINSELWGRPSTVPWAMIFPTDPVQVPRHPSQLYEALLEGLLLFIVLNALIYWTHKARKLPGLIVGLFFIGYGLARYLVEFARQPDQHLGLFADFISMGQILSLPMIFFGLWVIWSAATGHFPRWLDPISAAQSRKSAQMRGAGQASERSASKNERGQR